MKMLTVIMMAILVPQVVFAQRTSTEKCRKVANAVITKTDAQLKEKPSPEASGFNEYSNPWEYPFSSHENVCCVSYESEPPFGSECLTYTRDICVDISTMEIRWDEHTPGPYCGY